METNLIEWLKRFENGDFDSQGTSTQIDAGWYDWFCRETSLGGKTKKLGRYLKQIIFSKKFNPLTSYVFFKNNCPLNGTLYDDFRICDIKSEDVIFTIVPKSGYKGNGGKGEVWGKENSFDKPLFLGTWEEIKNWFNAP